MNYLLYNPLANYGKGYETEIKALKEIEIQFPDCEEIDYSDTIFEDVAKVLKPGDNIILLGGDGTINYLINDLKNIPTPEDINYYYYPAGTENDFMKDVQDKGFGNTNIIPLTEFIKKLPTVKFNNKEMLFFIAVGFGIDGKTYAEAEALRSKGKKINLNSITSSLVKKFEKTNCTVVVDGVTKEYKEVYLAPTMNSRYYVDGMNAAPEQNRLSGELSFVVIHDQEGRGAKALGLINKGQHTKFPEACEIIKGKHISVTFDKPSYLEVDGELFENITSYEAWTE